MSAFEVFLVRIFPHSDQKNSEYAHFIRSERHLYFHANIQLGLEF